jgi:hypothetical protein
MQATRRPAAACVRAALVSIAGLTALPAGAGEPTYWQDVRPLLRKHCTGCHSARTVADKDISGGLALDTYEAAIKGAAKPVIRPGNSAESPLVQLIVTADEERRMPLGRKPLPADAVDLLRRWIDGGAREGTRPDTETAARRGPARAIDVTLTTTLVPPRGVFPDVPPAALGLTLRMGPVPIATSVAFSPDGRLLACGSHRLVTLWDLQMGQVVRALTGLPGTVQAVRFSPDGSLLAVAGGQPGVRGDLRLFRTADGKPAGALAGHTDTVAAVAFSPDGKRLASGGFDKTVRLWNLESLKCERVSTEHADTVTALAFAPDGSWLASAGKDRTVRVVETATGKLRFSLGALDEVLAVAASPDGRWIVSAGADPALLWWDARSGKRERVKGTHRAAVNELTFSRDGRVVVSASSDRGVALWNADNGAQRVVMMLPSPICAAALTPDGKVVAGACFDGQVRLYETQYGKPRLSLLAVPHAEDGARWVALTPQGYVIGSPKLLIDGRWSMGGREVPADPVWRAVFNPEAVARAACGQPPPTPSFPAARPRR